MRAIGALYICISFLLAQMPGFILFGIADFVYILVYGVAGYRKKVVFENLRKSFPGKTEKEINFIARKYYRHLADLFIENIILRRISEKRIYKRFKVKNIEVLNNLYDNKKNVVAIIGHYANWEMLSLVSKFSKHPVLGVYKPLNNKFFDKEFMNMRQRFGQILVSMDNTYKTLFEYKKNNKYFALGLIADQRPPGKSANYWTTFLNQDTPVFLGPEKIAKKFDAAVVYAHVDKIKRGVYELEFSLLYENTINSKEGEITEKHLRFLENKIIQKPEFWLWSHKRWKFRKEDFAQ